jgi:hypothetical protein
MSYAVSNLKKMIDLMGTPRDGPDLQRQVVQLQEHVRKQIVATERSIKQVIQETSEIYSLLKPWERGRGKFAICRCSEFLVVRFPVCPPSHALRSSASLTAAALAREASAAFSRISSPSASTPCCPSSSRHARCVCACARVACVGALVGGWMGVLVGGCVGGRRCIGGWVGAC